MSLCIKEVDVLCLLYTEDGYRLRAAPLFLYLHQTEGTALQIQISLIKAKTIYLPLVQYQSRITEILTQQS